MSDRLTWPRPVYVPTYAMLQRALTKQALGDAVDPNGMDPSASRQVRAEGHVAEEVFAMWLQDMGQSYVWDGGPNGRPDFVLDGVPVGVRITAVSSGGFRDEHHVYVFERHLRGAPQRFFVGVDRGAGAYHVLGGIDMHAFVRVARKVPKGKDVCAGFTAQHDLRVALVGDLVLPGPWLRSIT